MRFLLVLSLLFSLAVPAHAESQTAAPDTPAPPPLLTPSTTVPAQAQPPAWLPQKRPATTPSTFVVKGPAKTATSIEKSDQPAATAEAKIGKGGKGGTKAKIAVKPKSAAPAKNGKKTPADATADEGEPIKIESVLTKELDRQNQMRQAGDTLKMLSSLVELQKNLKQQIDATGKQLKRSLSESKKQDLLAELDNLDKQLNDSSADFERLATGVDSSVFSDQKEESFSWKNEISVLIEPTIKELKQLTAHVRQKSNLKDSIVRYEYQLSTANAAVEHIKRLIAEANNPKIKQYLNELLPAWQNMRQRISGKLDLAERELNKMEAKDVSFIQNSSNSIRNFFRDRGWYLLMAMGTFVAVLLCFRLFARLVLKMFPGARKDQRPIHVRVLDIFFQFFSIISAICGFVLILYLGEDWFLLSATIIFIVGLAWTVRQAVPKMWRQVRLMLNMGAIREGERVVYQGVPWKIEAINFFCKLHNPALGMHIRIPIENITDLVSRPYEQNEPWFPCQTGDWVAIEGKSNAKVVSISPEQVELVELGGRKIVYPTGDFLSLSPANLSTNFYVRVVFGLSYDLQAEITTSVLEKLLAYIQQKFGEHGFAEDCLSLSVDFLQAGASSLDVVVFANMKGEQAPAFSKIERSISKWCVECCNQNNWEIPFPQMTVHLPGPAR